jgi:SecD/SecF fusion protein
MRLKGLVWFFTIALIIISIWELSYTWVIKSYESDVKAQAEKIVKRQSGYKDLSSDEKEALIKAKTSRILDSTRDKAIFPIFETSYQKCKENELNLGLDLQGGMSVTMDVSLEGMIKSLSNNPRDPQLLGALNTATAQKNNSESDYITLFSEAYIKQNGSGKLSSLFAGPSKDIKITDKEIVNYSLTN